MIYYDQARKKFNVCGMVFLVAEEDMPAIKWNSGDPDINILNNTFITTNPNTAKGAWYVTKYLLWFIFRAWKGLLK